MKGRFEGEDGLRRLVTALKSQKVCVGDDDIAAKFASVAELHEVTAGTEIITQGAHDNDAYFILAGSFAIIVEGHEVATRSANDCVGEMAAIDPSLPRSATVVAKETSVVAKVSEPDFIRTADACPKMWRALSQELAKRLNQRKELLLRPNEKPRLFIISSKEALAVARDIQQILQHDALVQVWTDGVFFASGYALEALEAAVADSDFAIAIAQPDDKTTSRGTENPTARDNVIFELGLFMGKLGRRRTILFQPEGQPLKLPSDLQGLTAIAYKTGAVKDMPTLLGGPCTDVRKLIQELGVRK
ncbi:MAG: nucleotide-binding protein [Alphaproteobacteria bacterium]|nr:nucleotide-binding protein [Alphaproteobacteria bacterium]